ncbi:MAG: hypothetical protein JWQ29_685 [Phenylobacterium sp.]|nr:hypothetical protein [Phenylobacterium sp.]
MSADAAKSCGDCGLCCKLMGVAAIDKAPLAWCRQFKRGCGCKIYETRPKACADFICYWLHAPNLGPEWRPDRAGFVLHISEQGRTLNVETDQANPNAWRAEPYRSQLTAWAAQGAGRALDLLVWTGRRCTRLTADGEEDRGLLRPAAPAARPAFRRLSA